MYMLKIGKMEQSGPDLKVSEFASVNMGGYFPMRLLNFVMGASINKNMGVVIQKIKDFEKEK